MIELKIGKVDNHYKIYSQGVAISSNVILDRKIKRITGRSIEEIMLNFNAIFINSNSKWFCSLEFNSIEDAESCMDYLYSALTLDIMEK